MNTTTLTRYRVHLSSQPSPAWTSYDGWVDVSAASDMDARIEALKAMKRGAFPERPVASWDIGNVEVLHARA